MHERGIVSEVAATFVDLLGDRRVESVTVVTGPGIVLDVAADTWVQATTGTPAEGARVVWETALDRLRCFGCGSHYDGDKLSPCPVCGEAGLVVQPAPEFAIQSWEERD